MLGTGIPFNKMLLHLYYVRQFVSIAIVLYTKKTSIILHKKDTIEQTVPFHFNI